MTKPPPTTSDGGREAEPAVSESSREDGQFAPSSSLSILIAEDNPVNQEVLVGFLARLGFAADVCSNGQEAVERVREKGYDLVLMDCHMPIMDGFEAARIITGNDPRPRVVALTASTSDRDRKASVAAGMEGFISKPIELAQLRAEIRAVLEGAAPPSAALKPAARSTTSEIQGNLLLQLYEDVPKACLKMIRLELSGEQRFLERLEEAAASGDYAASAELAHEWAGIVSALHLTEVRASLLDIEALARRGDPRCQQELTALPDKLARAHRELERFLADVSAKAG